MNLSPINIINPIQFQQSPINFDTIYINKELFKPINEVYEKIENIQYFLNIEKDELMKYPKIPNKGYYLFLSIYNNEEIYLYNFLLHHSIEFNHYINITNVQKFGMFELKSLTKNKTLYIIYDVLKWFLNIDISYVHNILVSKYYIHNYLNGILTIKKFIQWSFV
jgi:hypothetical protein